jgi:hypothetical protein
MQKQTRRARSRHGCGLLPGVAPRSHSSTRMRLLFAARTGGFFSLGVQDSTGTPAILSSCTLAAFIGTDKRRKVIKIPPQRLETLTAIFRYGCLCSLLYLPKHPRPLTETLANGNTADRWQTETKNELADLLRFSSRQTGRSGTLIICVIIYVRLTYAHHPAKFKTPVLVHNLVRKKN